MIHDPSDSIVIFDANPVYDLCIDFSPSEEYKEILPPMKRRFCRVTSEFYDASKRIGQKMGIFATQKQFVKNGLIPALQKTLEDSGYNPMLVDEDYLLECKEKATEKLEEIWLVLEEFSEDSSAKTELEKIRIFYDKHSSKLRKLPELEDKELLANCICLEKSIEKKVFLLTADRSFTELVTETLNELGGRILSTYNLGTVIQEIKNRFMKR